MLVHFFFPLPQQSAFNVLQPQHILPSAVHHSDSRDSRRGSGWKRSSRLPSVMDRNSLESPNGSNLTLTPSSRGLCDLSTCNPLTSGASAAHKKERVKKTVCNCIFHNEETGSGRPLYMQEVTQVSIRMLICDVSRFFVVHENIIFLRQQLGKVFTLHPNFATWRQNTGECIHITPDTDNCLLSTQQ